MRFKGLLILVAVTAAVTASSFSAKAQFKKDAFTQSYVDPNDTTFRSDTTGKLFSFKQYFGGLGHKNSISIGTMFAGSAVLPGTAQIYNKQYWKLPIIYGGIGTCAGLGGYYLHRYNISGNNRDKTIGACLLAGAGAIYWGSMLDGAICYNRSQYPLPGRATIYSILLPGLGQAYNGEYWKIPVYYTGLIASGYFLYTNNINYKRFKRIHNEATDPNIAYTGTISGETAKYYRDIYRRYRDYSIVATVLVYLLQVIDANVFAYMHDFEVTDDLSFKLSPTIIPADNCYAGSGISPNGGLSAGNNAFGLSVGLRF